MNASIEDNISIAGMSKFAVKDFLVLKNREKKYVNQQIEELSIKCSGRDQAVSQLSGGNKQKVVFGLAAEVKFLYWTARHEAWILV